MKQNNTDTNGTERRRNVIEPWRDPVLWYKPRQPTPDPKGTFIHYNGVSLRARGDYSTTLAGALITSVNHMLSEGYCSPHLETEQSTCH